ncbi:class I SAM-dependent methyltransferase [Lactobacillus mulieris]|nr:class I SAM-dependent methyltransferase [Lactobacillus mulieris]MCF1783055.1 class I SAM-dependent methyltransferase [Lactobacillus mulieris]MCW8104600.1 class I SAM-dependent methyltransferase [Lactobacillus mulieris]MDK6803450.1 class I SAM-dependent methyltransferase [Lactobacillus mulieris]MDK8382423.1 class I SAM-dependent methyltransferase [Lactobacillus mulieris]MDT9620750.1 class I SAM-dependent methyltransferase [Lactobacillus mulieris]
MAEQYFTKNPNTKHDLKVIDYHLDGIDLKLTTDAGIFSKNRVDYGSGVLIRNMLEENPVSGNILDVGCGYGPIGLFAAKKWPDRQVDMVDVNERAMDLARKNAEVNGVTNANIFASSVYENVDKQYAMILTNPPIRAGKNIVSEILEKSYEHLLVGGKLLVVIQKKQGAPSAKKLMERTFGNCEIVERDKGYYILRSVK